MPDYMEWCGTRQIIRYDVQIGVQHGIEKPLLVRAQGLEPWIDKDIVAVGVSDSCGRDGSFWLRLSTGAEVFIPLDDDLYPQVDKYLESSDEGVHVQFPKKLIKAVGRASLFSRASLSSRVSQFDRSRVGGEEIREGWLHVLMADGKITLTGKSEFHNHEYLEWESVEYHGNPIEFDIRPKMFTRVLEQDLSAEVTDKRLLLVGANEVGNEFRIAFYLNGPVADRRSHRDSEYDDDDDGEEE
jgi:hypothetical protein